MAKPVKSTVHLYQKLQATTVPLNATAPELSHGAPIFKFVHHHVIQDLTTMVLSVSETALVLISQMELT